MTTSRSASGRRADGPRGRPIVGVLPEVRRDALGFLLRTRAQYGDVARYRLGPIRTSLISHPDGVRHVLQEHIKNYTKDHVVYRMGRWVVGDGLLTSQGETWLRQRRLVQPAFHRHSIAALAGVMVRRTEELLTTWEPLVASGQPLDISTEMMRLALSIVGDALFGTDVAPQAAIVGRTFTTLNEQFITRFRSANLLPPVVPTPYNRAWTAALRELNAVVYAIIAERRRRGEAGDDLLSLLMLARDEETGAQMDDQALRDEVITMLLAGHETTATALSWVWGLLAVNPLVAARLIAEVDAVLGDRLPTAADVAELTYTRMVLDETLRLYPPVYILSRKARADDVIGGFRIPKGSAVSVSPYVTHRHPEIWDDPECFEPERFAPAQAAQRHKHAYLPFSSGPRMCIGASFALMEALLVIATIARHYRLHLVEERLPEPEPLITLRPRGGMRMRVERRTT